MRLGRTGTEPLQARSAYGFRKVLAVFGLVCGVVGTVLFGAMAFDVAGLRYGADRAALLVWSALFLALVVVAVLDLLVLSRRTRGQGQPRD